MLVLQTRKTTWSFASLGGAGGGVTCWRSQHDRGREGGAPRGVPTAEGSTRRGPWEKEETSDDLRPSLGPRSLPGLWFSVTEPVNKGENVPAGHAGRHQVTGPPGEATTPPQPTTTAGLSAFPPHGTVQKPPRGGRGRGCLGCVVGDGREGGVMCVGVCVSGCEKM